MEERDVIVLVSPNGQEKVCIYRRHQGNFGSRNFVWVKEEPHFEGWTVGSEWGHFYDTPHKALLECASRFSWINQYLGISASIDA